MNYTKKLKKVYVAAILSCVIALTGYGQTGIKGRVTDKEGAVVSFATITIDSLKIRVSSDENGVFTFKNVPAGSYVVAASMLGYEKQSRTAIVKAGSTVTLDFELEVSAKGLNEVIIAEQKKTDAERAREQAFTVTSIDVTALQNLNMDVNTVLNRTTGVRIRQEGGLGSDFSFSLNGFTGNQVRFFIDGIPSDYLGAALGFNNIPVNIVDRIEVYKGVVPVSLGADALGGAVNVITNDNTKNFLDVSYSYGSFNTHQASLAGRAIFKNSTVLNASGFFNYSDNNYKIDASTIDDSTGKINEPREMKRFNDGYMSASGMLETGVINKRFADKLLVGVIASGNRKEIQQGANMTKVAGEVFRTDISVTPAIKYQKNNLFTEGLSLKVAAIYTYSKSMTVDTSSKIYDWDGSYTTKSINMISGELNWDKTMFRFTDHVAFVNAGLEYRLGKHHTFALNNSYSWFQRQGTDPLRYSNIPFNSPNVLSKNVTGLSYKLSVWQNRFTTTVFVKLFNLNARVYDDNTTYKEYKQKKNKSLQHGEGIASTVFITKDLQAKVSYEYTARMPESYEMFGDGLLLIPNVNLKPEQSHNLNAGFLFGKRIKKDHLLNAEVGFIFREPKDMIRLVAIGITSVYENLSSGRTMGGEASIRYSYRQWISLELNTTYQDLRNTNRANNNNPDPLYLDRLPNIPYLFGNAILGFKSIELSKYKLQVGFDWSTGFVEQFYLKWPSQGNQDSKYVIPRQISHDASVTLSAFSGTYNISFSCLNIADTKRYDNFKVQKPGRSFNVKLRVFFTQFRNQ
jgi:outer membrane cobalamin receptor